MIQILQKRGRFLLIALIVSSSLFVTTAAYVLFFTRIRSDTSRSFSTSYALIDPARSLIGQEHFFSSIEPLRRNLKELAARYEKEGGEIGVYFEYLNTGANISINQDKRFWPASLSKMPTALVVMKKIERGDWKLTNEFVIFPEDRNDAFGTLWQKPAGTRLTIEELLKELLINSDDTAHRILIRNLSAGEFEDMLFALGIEEMYDKNYNITAKEYSRIFRALYSSSYLEREYSQMLLAWLSETRFHEFLGSGLPPDVIFAHKIGEHDPEVIYLDSGVVYAPNRPYLLTVMVDAKQSGGKEKAKEIMSVISRAAYEYVANN